MENKNLNRSSAERFLVGKKPPNTQKAIKQIDVAGNYRIIHYVDGSIRRVSKAQLMQTFQATLSAYQRKEMEKTIRVQKNGDVTVRLGGMVKGKVKTYKSIARAKAALARRYPKIPINPHVKTIAERQVPTGVPTPYRYQGHYQVTPLLRRESPPGGPKGYPYPNTTVVGGAVQGVRIRPARNS